MPAKEKEGTASSNEDKQPSDDDIGKGEEEKEGEGKSGDDGGKGKGENDQQQTEGEGEPLLTPEGVEGEGEKVEKKRKGCSKDEVLAVLAHELGHWKCSHNLINLSIGEVRDGCS
jgi:hypothetical protein